LREVAASLSVGRGKGAVIKLRLTDARPLVAEEEERLILSNRPADRAAELILNQEGDGAKKLRAVSALSR